MNRHHRLRHPAHRQAAPLFRLQVYQAAQEVVTHHGVDRDPGTEEDVAERAHLPLPAAVATLRVVQRLQTPGAGAVVDLLAGVGRV